MKNRVVSKLLAVVMAVAITVCYIPAAFALDGTGSTDSQAPAVEATTPTGSEDGADTADSGQTSGQTDREESTTDAKSVTDYADFLADLKVLEGYADEFTAQNPEKNAMELVLNYVRTGVPKYAESTWSLVAGPEDTDFTAYVAKQDAAKGTSASALRDLQEFKTPNGQTVEFRHMFGTMNITWYQRNNTEYGQDQADMGGWAGDVCDLMSYTNGKVDVAADADDTAIDEAAKTIRTKYLGVDDPSKHTFGILDIYGDLDGYYFMNEAKADNSKKLSALMEGYYTKELSDKTRADYFMTNRLNGTKTKAGVRAKLLKAYTENSMIDNLEKSRDLNGDTYAGLRKACTYAFADYLTELAGDESATGTDPDVDPVDPDKPDTPDTPKDDDNNGLDKNDYYTEFSRSLSTLAPGIQQRISYATSKDDKQMVYYTATVDINREDLSIYANYKDNDASQWGMARVTDQMAAAAKKHSDPDSSEYIKNYNPVVGVNADYYDMANGVPSGALAIGGKIYNGVGSENFFGILKDGTPIIGGSAEWKAHKDDIQEAVGGGAFIVKDGKIAVGSDSNYYNSRASRTCVGLTKDGKVVLMALDGRQEPFSCGGSAQEIAQIMLDAGCVSAINLDGGGSTTFAAKEEGEDEVRVINRPSDGFERSVSSSLMVVSTAKPSDAFDHAVISSENDYKYLTKNSSVQLTAKGVNDIGGSAELPANTSWKVKDTSVGTVDKDGNFTAAANGTTDVQLTDGDGKVLGTITMNVVTPDALSFEKDNITTVYEATVPLPIQASYKENPVKISPKDVTLNANPAKGGTIDDFSFTACKEEAGVRNVKIEATLNMDMTISAKAEVNIFSQGEAVFDFDKVDGGNRSLGWTRSVMNSTKEKQDETDIYHAKDPTQPMDVSYVFALDMREIPIPEKLKSLVTMVAGGDMDGVTPWRLLLQLAGRVSQLTTVEVDIKIDPNMDVDYSNLKVVTDYFHLDEDATEFDKDTNTLKCYIKWDDDESEPIPESEANPICIVSGLKLTPKDDAKWDNDRLTVKNSGNLSYDIYLAASALYTDNFQSLGLYKYDNSQGGTNYVADGSHLDRGAHFIQKDFKTFSDSFVLDKSNRQGWYSEGDDLYYYKNNEKLTGIQEVPGYKDAENKYYYEFDKNGVCQGKVTGLFQKDGATYYAIDGQLKSGWRVITDEQGNDTYYYFGKDYKAVDGKQKIDGYNYVFKDHVLIHGDLVKTDKDTRYMWAGQWTLGKWETVDGNTYYFNRKGYAETGIFHPYNISTQYLADENGVWQKDFTGIYTDDKGDSYYVEKGILNPYPGLVKIGDDYYYFRSSAKMVKDTHYWTTKTNGLLPEASYQFDKDGKMVNPPKVDPGEDPSQTKNGIVAEDGSLYYYVDGKRTYAGLIKIDGDYYYVRSSGEVVHDRSYWTTKTNGLLPGTTYKFDKDGKIIDPPKVDPSEDPSQTKNGIVAENGSLYYYKDGKIDCAGLIKIDGDYYYVRTSNGEVVHGRSYWVSHNNGLPVPEASYQFDKDGKMIDPPKTDSSDTGSDTPSEPEKPATKNGIVSENGNLYYYKDGKLDYAGLIQIDGDYYYVRSTGEVVHGRTYWPTKTNGLLPSAEYTFDKDGKMVK